MGPRQLALSSKFLTDKLNFLTASKDKSSKSLDEPAVNFCQYPPGLSFFLTQIAAWFIYAMLFLSHFAWLNLGLSDILR